MTTGRINQVTIICRNKLLGTKTSVLSKHKASPPPRERLLPSVFHRFPLVNLFTYFWRLKSQPKVDDHYSFSVQAHYLYRHRKPSCGLLENSIATANNSSTALIPLADLYSSSDTSSSKAQHKVQRSTPLRPSDPERLVLAIAKDQRRSKD